MTSKIFDVIIEELKQKYPHGGKFSKKAFLKVLHDLLAERNIKSLQSLYNYYTLLKIKDVIKEKEEEGIIYVYLNINLEKNE